MSTVVLKGEDAIHYAELHHLTLNKYPDDDEPAEQGLTVERAWTIVEKHPELIWLSVHQGVNTADMD
ncbi:MAG: hypothetical protein OES46_21920 [Gammaproteobacteria bacterium]|nr:hypothetical protein [Gammaproteobacteria bacterium]